jgi:hypothetical protein
MTYRKKGGVRREDGGGEPGRTDGRKKRRTGGRKEGRTVVENRDTGDVLSEVETKRAKKKRKHRSEWKQ